MKRASQLPLSTIFLAVLLLSGCSFSPTATTIDSPQLPDSSVQIETEPRADLVQTPEETVSATPEPTANVNKEIADYPRAASFTQASEELFFRTEPTLVDASELQSKCGDVNASATSNILGCFTTNPNRIYLFDITDSRMAKAENVIAAHELLHAVWYMELTSSERTNLTIELRSFFDALPANHYLRDRLKLYAEKPESIPTELHSILGTESLNLSPALENHYAKYFRNRLSVVADAEATFGYIRDLSKQAEEGSLNIGSERNAIDKERAYLSSQSAILEKDISDFNARVKSNSLSKQAYETQKAELDERKESLESAYAVFNKRVEDFNDFVVENNEISELVNSLNKALSTK